MKVRFWGTRGSIATPGPATVRYGGNTSCVEVRSRSGTLAVLDCGTGAHALGLSLTQGRGGPPSEGHLLIGHTHWDHIQGVPFFAPLRAPGTHWDIYAPRGLGESLRETLAGQMQYTYFPVTLEDLGATVRYHDLVEGEFEIGDIRVTARYLNHTALTLGYRLEADGMTVVYACDHEPHSHALALGNGAIGDADRRHVEFLRDADLVIHDAQYTITEYPNRVGWGHSTSAYAIRVCREAGARRLALTHHDPERDDDSLDALAAALATETALAVFAAAEGMTVDLGERTAPPARVVAPAAAPTAADTAVAPALWEHAVLLGSTDGPARDVIPRAAHAEKLPVIEADNGAALLRRFEAEHPSLVVLDPTLRGDNPISACRAIRLLEGKNAGQVPVVVLAGQGPPAEAAAAGITDWLTAPISVEYARTHLRAWVLRSACRWQRASRPSNEARRLAALRRLALLDTETEERFDRLTRIAATAFEMPIALISLVDAERQWFKANVGLDARETHRDLAFCAHAILEAEPLIVSDTLADPRFADNPLVTGDPRVRFYAGFPLTMAEGSRVGTLCLLDHRPRALDESQMALLGELAKLVEDEMQRRPSTSA